MTGEAENREKGNTGRQTNHEDVAVGNSHPLKNTLDTESGSEGDSDKKGVFTCRHETTTPYPDHRLGRTLPDGSRTVLQRELRRAYRGGDGCCFRYGGRGRELLSGAGR